MSVFEQYRTLAWPHRFAGQLHIPVIAGGTPSDPKVTEGWIRTKLAPKDDLLRDLVTETMLERGISEEQAVELVDQTKHLNGFRRDPERDGELYIEGRCLKAALKEAAMVAANAGKLSTKGWGNPDNATFRKGLKGWLPEHVFVLEDRLYLGTNEATGIVQRFVHTHRGAAIQYEEYVEKAVINFTVVSDFDFTDEQWAMIWLTGEQQGLGASRSQGYGRYVVTQWERV